MNWRSVLPPIVSAYVLTQAQRASLLKVYRRQPSLNAMDPRKGRPGRSYLQFRKTARYDFLLECVMVPFCGMWLGIERDGHTHS